MYNLGSGEATSRQATVKVSDGEFHVVTVERLEQRVQLVVDGSYVARSVSPGDEATLDIPPDAIYLGASVDSEDKLANGFVGCLRGVKIDRKDLPVFGENEDFIANPSATGTKESECPGIALPLSPTETSLQAGYVYGGLVGVLAVLIVVVVCFVSVILVIRRTQSRKKNTFRIGEGQASPSALAWHPTGRRTRFQYDSASEDFALESMNKNSNNTQQAFHPIFSPSPILQPSLSGTTFTSPSEQLLPRQGSRSIAHSQRVRSPKHGGHGDSNSHQQQLSGVTQQEVPPPPYHVRTVSEQQSIVSMRSGGSSIYQDDSEVAKYILKQKEGADGQIEEMDIDEIMPFKDEGEFEPLGSIGSLHEIVMATDDGDNSILSTQATLSSHGRSHVSEDSVQMGDYGKRLDDLMDRLHNLTADLDTDPPTTKPHKRTSAMRIV